jgi:hypothetical protein
MVRKWAGLSQTEKVRLTYTSKAGEQIFDSLPGLSRKKQIRQGGTVMKLRYILMFIATLILVGAVATGVIQALNSQPALRTVASLENVRAYAAAPTQTGVNYAVESGVLFAGQPMQWTEVRTPNDVIVSTVVIDPAQPERVYIGAANELAVYRTVDQGANWLRVELGEDGTLVGGVTSLSVDPVQHLLYVGTDTAGLFRLRDVGSSMVLTAHLLVEEPIQEIVVDTAGKGFLFARTDWTLYRGENYGLAWVTVDELRSTPTALAIGGGENPAIYVGTTDRGIVRSTDGYNWATANEGLNFVPGSRLYVNALAVDPVQPDLLYVATSYLYGSTELHNTPSTVFMGSSDALAWAPVDEALLATVAELMPVSGQPGAVYAVTTASRTPLALGTAPEMATVAAGEPVLQELPAQQAGLNWTALLSWLVAGLAALALLFAISFDLRRRPVPVRRIGGPRRDGLTEQTVRNER